jgi:hypothetical protein
MNSYRYLRLGSVSLAQLKVFTWLSASVIDFSRLAVVS